MSMAGLDMEAVRDGLGHSSTTTTRNFYANPSLDKLKKTVDNVHGLQLSDTGRKAGRKRRK